MTVEIRLIQNKGRWQVSIWQHSTHIILWDDEMPAVIIEKIESKLVTV